MPADPHRDVTHPRDPADGRETRGPPPWPLPSDLRREGAATILSSNDARARGKRADVLIPFGDDLSSLLALVLALNVAAPEPLGSDIRRNGLTCHGVQKVPTVRSKLRERM